MKSVLAFALLALFPIIAGPAAALDAPKGPVMLTVTGNITHTNDGKTATFDGDMLKSLEGRRAAMETPWTEGKTSFEGPLLKAVLDAVGAKGKTLKVKALNDYSADVPAEDAWELDTILAMKLNDQPMSVRDKGPLFLVYPFDLNPEIYNEKYFSRSVWQIKEIEVID